MQGTKPCKDCINMYARSFEGHLDDNEVTIRCVDKSRIVFHTDETLYGYYDAIEAADPSERDELQQCYGIKFNPHGLMSNQREFYKPVSHTIRDWMHMLVSSGVANTQAALLLCLLMAHGITLKAVGTFIECVHLPHRYGKTSATWVSIKRLGKKRDALASFAIIMLSLIPILACYLEELIDDEHPLVEHKRCWHLLEVIVSVLSLGPELAMPHLARLSTVIDEWGTLYERLYPGANVKPKFHNFVIHVISDAMRLGKLMSCFVTERKHRATKRAALFVFRHIDNTVVKDMLNRQCDAIRGGTESLFTKEYLVKPAIIEMMGTIYRSSKEVVLACGSLFAGDVLLLSDGRVGRADRFWSDGEEIVAQLSAYAQCTDNANCWDRADPQYIVVSTSSIVDAVMWYEGTPASVIRVIKPACASW